jgi:hypothetical protein
MAAFDDDENDSKIKKSNLKQVSAQKSIFDSMPKKPSQDDLNRKVQDIQDKDMSFKVTAMDLTSQYKKSIADKTLKQNKSVFAAELEQELVGKMIQLGLQINDDEMQKHNGSGSMGWIILLLKTCLYQRDRINDLEHTLFQFDKKIESVISKEIQRILDSKKI